MTKKPYGDAMISFRIPAALREQIDALATLWDVPMSFVVRRLLEGGLASLNMNQGSPITMIHDGAKEEPIAHR